MGGGPSGSWAAADLRECIERGPWPLGALSWRGHPLARRFMAVMTVEVIEILGPGRRGIEAGVLDS